MNYWPLLGIAVIVIGFLLRFNPVSRLLVDVVLVLEIALRTA